MNRTDTLYYFVPVMIGAMIGVVGFILVSVVW